VLWTNDPAKLQANPFLQPLTSEPRFRVQKIDMVELAQGTPVQSSKILSLATDKKAWLDGDLVRILLLYKYGGVWVDMDYLVLRDFRPLLEQEWLVQWDCYDKPYTPLNGAVMHFRKASPYLCEMLYAMTIEPPPRTASMDWGSLLYYKVYRRLLASGRKPFGILPWCLMDPRNCKLNNRLPDPFQADPKMHKSRAAQLEQKLASIVRFRSSCSQEADCAVVCYPSAQPVGQILSKRWLGRKASVASDTIACYVSPRGDLGRWVADAFLLSTRAGFPCRNPVCSRGPLTS
jgi:hypothetical protein